MKKRAIVLIAIALVLAALIAGVVYHQHPSKSADMPELHTGQKLRDMLDTYGTAYESFGRIYAWKDQECIILAGFSGDNTLEQYGIFDLHHRYVSGNIDNESIGSIWWKVLTGGMSQLQHVYDVGSGITIYGKITRSGVIAYWSDPWDFELFDPLAPAYSGTPWLLFLLAHPILSWF